jgi:hypothetical protein
MLSKHFVEWRFNKMHWGYKIPNFIIKGSSPIFPPPLTHVSNLSLTGKFPSLRKQMAVVPIFKKGNKI